MRTEPDLELSGALARRLPGCPTVTLEDGNAAVVLGPTGLTGREIAHAVWDTLPAHVWPTGGAVTVWAQSYGYQWHVDVYRTIDDLLTSHPTPSAVWEHSWLWPDDVADVIDRLTPDFPDDGTDLVDVAEAICEPARVAYEPSAVPQVACAVPDSTEE